MVAEAFEVIATHPLERRSRKIADNIVIDVRKRAHGLLSEYRSSQANLMLQRSMEVTRLHRTRRPGRASTAA